MSALFHSPKGLYPFQAEHVGWCCARPNNLLAWDTGLGKSVAAMATAALLFEDGVVDHVLLVCEQNKVGEWLDDFGAFTSLSVGKYHGASRAKLRLAPPQVIVTTYETARIDLAVRRQGDPRKLDHGPLLSETLVGKRVLVVYDEMSKLGNRSSLLYKSHVHALKSLQDSGCRILGLTATPMERNPESYYNLGRILTPATMGTVKSFLNEHVVEFDAWGTPSRFKHLEVLADKMSPVMLRKRKTDRDVVDQFPKLSERFSYVTLTKDHQTLYETVHDHILSAEDEMAEKVGVGLLRQLAGHPASLFAGQGEMAMWTVAHYGEQLRAIKPAKVDHLVAYLRQVVEAEGQQAVVFTYYVSILDLLAQTLRSEGFSVVTNHGRMSTGERDDARRDFRSGKAQIFLSSSAGEKGINLPEAGVVVNYDLPTKHSSYIQRINRISRIGQGAEFIVAKSFIVRDTIEEGLAKLWLTRNRQHEVLLDGDVDDADDEEWMSSADRRSLLRHAQPEPQKGTP